MIRHRVIEGLPLSVRGLVHQDLNGDYMILINANLSDEQKERTMQHELNHIMYEDFLSEEEAVKIEKTASFR